MPGWVVSRGVRVRGLGVLSASAGGVVKVKELDWLKEDLCTGVCVSCPLPRWLLCSLEFSALRPQ